MFPLSYVDTDIKKIISCQNIQVHVDPVILKYTILVQVTYNSSKSGMKCHIHIHNIFKIFQVCKSISTPQKLKITVV